MDTNILIEVSDLSVTYSTGHRRTVHAVNSVTLSLKAGEGLAIVGESGSGKSTLLRAVLGLLPRSASVDGHAYFQGVDLINAGPRTQRDVRGRGIGIVLQDPSAALNPMMRIGRQVAEGVQAARACSKSDAMTRATQLIELVGIPDSKVRADLFPHELSGGLRQRAAIAIALSTDPLVLFCDEPTSALDVTIQNQITQLLQRLRNDLGVALVFVTHDLALVPQIAERTAVMYAGIVVETGPTRPMMESPRHPYTDALLRAMPRLSRMQGGLHPIPGEPPSAALATAGCPFEPRCPMSAPECLRLGTALKPISMDRASACIKADKLVNRQRGSTDETDGT